MPSMVIMVDLQEHVFSLSQSRPGLKMRSTSYSHTQLKQRKFCRMIPILQFLADLELELSEAPENNQSHLDVIETLRKVLEEMRSSGKAAIVYTDGSTAGGKIANRK